MPRHVSLPGADELFRATSPGEDEAQEASTKPARRTTRRKAVVPPFEEALPPETRQRVAGKRAPKAQVVAEAPVEQQDVETGADTPAGNAPVSGGAARRAAKKAVAQKTASGRVRHDEKITVYVSTEELIALETGRLALRGEHGLAVDRGRIVRESIAIIMADLAAHGADSELVRRLNGQ